MDIDVIKEGINTLIRAGYYKDKEKCGVLKGSDANLSCARVRLD